MRRRLMVYLAGLILVAGLTHCGGASRRAEPITIKGSDTMVILGQRWAEAYMAAHPGTVIQVTGGGSGTGIAALINGTTDIAQSSREMKEEERKQVQDKSGVVPEEIVVARDGVTVYLHASNAVAEITMEQLRDIYTGRLTNWKQLGGPDGPITVYGRENNSGTYVFFKEHVLANQDFAAAVQTLPGTAAVVNAVAQDPRGIGYGGAAYAQGVKELPIKPDAASPAVSSSAENVKSGAYPLARPLYFYLRTAPAGDTKTYIDWVLSPDGQRLVTEVGYFPV
jgi:phosphate transport system substrate-binding protein